MFRNWILDRHLFRLNHVKCFLLCPRPVWFAVVKANPDLWPLLRWEELHEVTEKDKTSTHTHRKHLSLPGYDSQFHTRCWQALTWTPSGFPKGETGRVQGYACDRWPSSRRFSHPSLTPEFNSWHLLFCHFELKFVWKHCACFHEMHQMHLQLL